MSTLLQQLENNEAILLMYLAGELPEADRVEVEQMLVNDGRLRDALSDLAALHADVDAALTTGDVGLDRVGPATARRREAAVRRIVRSMAATDAAPIPLIAPARETAAGRPRLRWFAYPTAAAALLAVGIIVMSARAPSVLNPGAEVMMITQAEMNAPTPRIFEAADPAIDRIEAVESQVLSLHVPEAGLFEYEVLDADR